MYVCVFLAVLQCIFFHIIFVGSNRLMNWVEVVLRISMILSLLLCFNYMHELLSSLSLAHPTVVQLVVFFNSGSQWV